MNVEGLETWVSLNSVMYITITVPLNVLFGQKAITYCAYLVRQITVWEKKMKSC